MPPTVAQTPMIISVRVWFELLLEEDVVPEVAVFDPPGATDISE